MTFTSVAQANSKTAEFARLFDLFDRVATRRTRALTGSTSEVISADDIANVPAEFAPTLKNLSTILSLRAQAASTTRARRNTLTSAPSMTLTAENQMPRVDVTEPSDEVEEEPESPTFPLGERYPFTFKLMLHKLYDLDEWAEKVKNAVEISKSQFKPLAERVQNVVRDATANIKERGEKRSNVRPVLGASAKFGSPSTTRHSAATSSKPETSRVLKKRCIGRRKSVNGPMSTGVWVYDAAISATEVTGPRSAVEITLSMPRDAGGVVENRARHRSLTALEEIQARDIAGRKIKIAVPLPQEAQEVSQSVPPQPPSVSFTEPAQEAIKMESVVKKRRLLASAFTSESCKRAAVKRPLCV
ncbi:hypothetical protein J3R83DRAFT_8042 [Lanmaoa asiatica]|nr:hypothetical protein J3R83DRAFT_8042 [Lanmaoa asiatica]